MKKIIFTIVLIIFSSQVFAQVILTSSINPVPGDIESWSICDTTNITPGSPGAGQTWNFTVLTRQDTSTVHYVAAGSTPYTADFPSSNIASTNDNSTYNYGTTSQVNFLVNGTGSPGLIIHYTDPQMLLQYPFTYGSTFTDTYSANYNIGGIAIIETGTSNINGDAWGTINLPDGSFANALRVKEIMVTKDSSNSGTPMVIVTIVTTYSWFVPGRKFRVFGIVYSSATLNGISFSGTKFVNYNNNSTIGIENISIEIPGNYILSQNYPNPFNPSTNLKFSITKPGFVTLKIYDMLGREITTLVNADLNAGTYKYYFDASGYTSGIYFYTLKTNEFTETKKMLLNK